MRLVELTLVEVCCGEDITHISENGEFKLDIESSAIIQDVKLLEELLLHRKIWNKAEQGVWETLLAALEVLIQADHHQQVFNIKPLLKAQVVHHFLLTCQVLQHLVELCQVSFPLSLHFSENMMTAYSTTTFDVMIKNQIFVCLAMSKATEYLVIIGASEVLPKY
ncbi:PREDICTED: lysosomal-trafficking regulator-like isoform X1 [Galeopterus variegatus]|uniref:Lysosomal-trafficking regulator-like isoform X1 n=1 Tax=Galeopterus variegatus TaxID=482537 RepID=A0ABM0SDM3_GALVR|nr:PREDICTED: lysosomal-trafficking regulator-like isoform X1 [Galeopterus variegatus]XP_008590964.1 PREDICTED: lysosomal-trafficking regulator-like isoform X1 [Galeopterus variegatus]